MNIDEAINEFKRLLEIMLRLRKECPWDRAQTNETLRTMTIEEVYELSEAILENDDKKIKEELGDIMLHLMFYSIIADEKDSFDITEVLKVLNEKLIRRHPHIFSDVIVNNANEVKQNWEKIKLAEGKKSVLEGVPPHLPSMVKAYRLQEKAKGVGFDWENINQVYDKLSEEISELHHAINSANQQNIEEELGDVFFALINYSRFLNINPDDALEKANKKFIYRFKYIEQKANDNGSKINNLSLEEMDKLWNEAKKKIIE
ncbi:MAG TPA: nucleoside triphosphate pyrophosphohydrolase [Bacteroidales bacterium]|nr:nucleoside triphosphate pyrophosphohydrolase [Bacteroidales bacterium]HPU47368.1 nucleoside triphosphate pyrophosphohydrolase [Bacteroidales bacterium]HPZ36838.1 nucleoside triphosphate pyrophosphohydrolase [Bacteroidales bacterium]HQD35235.1 nucleoside triphosphate pyrophosphohydrolase [Bacteroidales bacterium]HXK91466.1 nucleoside triphosphate pyrophosphohydrolase [Bacteroidales bacterium]